MFAMRLRLGLVIAGLLAAACEPANSAGARPYASAIERAQRAVGRAEIRGTPMRLRGGVQAGYSLGIRDSMMIAHSFKGAEFG